MTMKPQPKDKGKAQATPAKGAPGKPGATPAKHAKPPAKPGAKKH